MLSMIACNELAVDPQAPGRDLLKSEMKAFAYMPNGRFRKMEAKTGHHDDAVMATALAALVARKAA
ncbi:MAG: hypothetical protein ABJK75_10780 [Tateyamaria sp.]